MAEITNLNILYKNNKFKDIIIPLIQYFNQGSPTAGDVSPWSALAAASALKRRSLNWGGGNPPLQAVNYKRCCCPDQVPGQGVAIKCEYIKITQQNVNKDCSTLLPCGDEASNLSTAVVQVVSEQELIKLGAAEAGFENPYTPEIRKFELQLAGMSMIDSNDYVYFQQMIDAFYNNVGFIYYFTNTFKEGQYSSLYLGILGGDLRDGFRTKGIVVDNIGDGSPGDKAYTDIFIGETGNPGDVAGPAPYFTIFDSVNSEQVFWMRIGGSYEQPVVPAGVGVVQTYNVIDLATNTPQADIANTLASSIAGTGVFDNITIIADVVKVTANEAGSQTQAGQADFTAPGGGLPNVGKSFTFTPGTDSSGEKVTDINYAEASLSAMYGTWFKMYGADDDGVLFYYETTAYPIDPTTFGVAYTTAVAINLSDTGCVVHPPLDGQFVTPCPTSNPQEAIANITSDAIIGTGLFLAAGAVEKCCQHTPCKDYAGNPCTPPESPECCGPCNRFAAVASADFPDSEGGTATVGPANQVMDVISPAGTNWGTAFSDADYVDLWNANVPAEMKALGRPTHYYKSAGSSGGPCYKALADPCPSGCSPTGTYCRCDQPCDSAVGSVLLQTAYLAVTDQMPFNRPGVTSWNGQAEPCDTCFF